jgi:hypothetical protein
MAAAWGDAVPPSTCLSCAGGPEALQAKLPEVWDDLLAAGAEPVAAPPAPPGSGGPDGREELMAVRCRRSSQRVLRAAAEREAGLAKRHRAHRRSGSAAAGRGKLDDLGVDPWSALAVRVLHRDPALVGRLRARRDAVRARVDGVPVLVDHPNELGHVAVRLRMLGSVDGNLGLSRAVRCERLDPNARCRHQLTRRTGPVAPPIPRSRWCLFPRPCPLRRRWRESSR